MVNKSNQSTYHQCRNIVMLTMRTLETRTHLLYLSPIYGQRPRDGALSSVGASSCSRGHRCCSWQACTGQHSEGDPGSRVLLRINVPQELWLDALLSHCKAGVTYVKIQEGGQHGWGTANLRSRAPQRVRKTHRSAYRSTYRCRTTTST